MRELRLRVRGHVNRAVLLASLAVALPAIVAAEKARRGWGRRVAVRATRVVSRLLGIRITISAHPEAAACGAAVVVPNHRSPLDIPAVLLARPGTGFVAAAELLKYPLLRTAFGAMDTVPVDRGDARQALAMVRSLSERTDRDLVIFAEGGIVDAASIDGPVAPLRSGAFRIAIASGLPVLPVAITGAVDVVGPHGWLIVRPGRVHVEVGAPIPTKGLGPRDRNSLRDETAAALAALLA